MTTARENTRRALAYTDSLGQLSPDHITLFANVASDVWEPALTVLKKIMAQDSTIILNPGGYLVMHDPDGDPRGMMTACIDLTPEEIALVKEALGEVT